MSKLEVNAVEPQCGTNLTLGASGDTIIIPSGATISNQGTAAGFGPTGAVSWNTTKITANPNPAVSGVGYFADTTSAAFTITLPSSPSAGAVIGIADYANTFATNNLTVDRNGSNIGGVADNAVLLTDGVSVTFVYVDATQGWIVTDSGNRSDLPVPEYIVATGGTITCDGDYKIHTFTGPGTFTVCSVGNPAGSNTVDYLVVAGGGSGGNNGPGAGNGSGGGAGGFRESKATGAPWTASPLATSTSLPVSATAYPITVGAGAPGTSCHSSGTSFGAAGNPSTFSTITSAGGGFGSGNGTTTGGSGGSGGGGTNTAGTGNTPPVAPPQGNPGASGSGGGGGATIAGSPASGPGPGTGGTGAGTGINPSPTVGTPGPSAPLRYFAGGGGAYVSSLGYPDGGIGGGGTGNPAAPSVTSGTANTGGGGGGNGCGSSGTSGAGGSGIVIIRYKFQ